MLVDTNDEDIRRWVPQDTIYVFMEHPGDRRRATFERLEAARLTKPRYSHTAAMFRGRLWVAGGLHIMHGDGWDEGIANSREPFRHHRVEVMDLSADVLTFVELPTTRRDYARWESFNARLLVVHDELYCVSWACPPTALEGYRDVVLIEKLNLDTSEWVAVSPPNSTVAAEANDGRGLEVGVLDSTIFVFDLFKWIAFDLTTMSWHEPNPNATDRYRRDRFGMHPPGRSECRNGAVVGNLIMA
jgi:hypothetical protein